LVPFDEQHCLLKKKKKKTVNEIVNERLVGFGRERTLICPKRVMHWLMWRWLLMRRRCVWLLLLSIRKEWTVIGVRVMMWWMWWRVHVLGQVRRRRMMFRGVCVRQVSDLAAAPAGVVWRRLLWRRMMISGRVREHRMRVKVAGHDA
jgi:hypothetical protein